MPGGILFEMIGNFELFDLEANFNNDRSGRRIGPSASGHVLAHTTLCNHGTAALAGPSGQLSLARRVK